MTRPARVSVVVPFRDAAATLPALAKALAESSGGAELVGVDDASTDGGADILRGAGFRIVTHEMRRGPAAARNAGAREAKGEVLLFLDADVIPPAGLIEHVAARFAADAALVALSGVYDDTPANAGLVPRYKALRHATWFHGVKRFGSLETACGAVRRDAFLEAGGFDERYAGADVEDYEFGYRLAGRAGIEIDPVMCVRHHFPGLRRELANIGRRAFLWARLARPSFFDTAATTRVEALGAMASLAAEATLFACLAVLLIGEVAGVNVFFVARSVAFAALAFFLLSAGLRGRFLFRCLARGGPFFAIAAFAIVVLSDLVVVPCAVAGTIVKLVRGR
ncbi:glycosyltransferase [bacterium]|nr:glycosyltransferase [bacterium]